METQFFRSGLVNNMRSLAKKTCEKVGPPCEALIGFQSFSRHLPSIKAPRTSIHNMNR